VFDYGDEQWWNMARFAFGTPYFLVTYALEEMYATYILCQPTQLRAAFLDPEISISDVLVIYRAAKSDESRAWAAGQLQSVLVGLEGEPSRFQRAYVFVLQDGTRILRSNLVDDECDLIELEEWFSF
jgi:hypothetical protein